MGNTDRRTSKAFSRAGHTQYSLSQLNLYPTPIEMLHMRLEKAEKELELARKGQSPGRDIVTHTGPIHIDPINLDQPAKLPELSDTNNMIALAELNLRCAQTKLVREYAENGIVFDIDSMEEVRKIPLENGVERDEIIAAANKSYQTARKVRDTFIQKMSDPDDKPALRAE